MIKPEFGAIIGRFQFLHNGHERLIVEAAAKCETLLILIGSSQEEGTIKNPMSVTQRGRVISACLHHNDILNAVTIPVPDMLYNDDQWVSNLEDLVIPFTGPIRDSIPLYCFDRGGDHDERSCMEPSFHVECMGDDHCGVSSTDLREIYCESDTYDNLLTLMPAYSLDYIKGLNLQPFYLEYMADKVYKKSWEAAKNAAPYPLPNFDCVDVIVVRGDQILTVVRGEYPGKGKRAMPGGFVDKGDTYLAASVRELREETGLICEESDLNFGTTLSAANRGGDRNTVVSIVDFDKCSGILAPQEGEVQSLEWVGLPRIGEKGWFSDHAHIISLIANGVLRG